MRLSEKTNANYYRLRHLIYEKGIQEPDGFREFVKFYLPYGELPKKVKLDSSFERGRKLLQIQSIKPVLYGYSDSLLFAVKYTWNSENILTIFMEGIDYHKEFVYGLREYAPYIPLELAERISNSISHDSYYALSKTCFFNNSVIVSPDIRESNAMAFASDVAWRSGLSAGDTIFDILNGPTRVFYFNNSKFVNIDDEIPACFLLDNIFYIYNP